MVVRKDHLHNTPKRTFSAKNFKEHVLGQASRRREVVKWMGNHQKIFVHYEELPHAIERVVKFLGVPVEEVNYEVPLLRQRQYNDPFDVIENPEEIKQAVKELGYESMA